MPGIRQMCLLGGMLGTSAAPLTINAAAMTVLALASCGSIATIALRKTSAILSPSKTIVKTVSRKTDVRHSQLGVPSEPLRGRRLKLSAGDAGRVLGLSHQRVHQLAQPKSHRA